MSPLAATTGVMIVVTFDVTNGVAIGAKTDMTIDTATDGDATMMSHDEVRLTRDIAQMMTTGTRLPPADRRETTALGAWAERVDDRAPGVADPMAALARMSTTTVAVSVGSRTIPGTTRSLRPSAVAGPAPATDLAPVVGPTPGSRAPRARLS